MSTSRAPELGARDKRTTVIVFVLVMAAICGFTLAVGGPVGAVIAIALVTVVVALLLSGVLKTD